MSLVLRVEQRSPLGMASVWTSGTRECIGDGWTETEAVLQEEGGRAQIGTVSTITAKKAEAAYPCLHRRQAVLELLW